MNLIHDIDRTPDLLQAMLDRPFPSAAEAPPGIAIFDLYDEFLRGTPERLITVLAHESHDESWEEAPRSAIDCQLDFEALLRDATAACEKRLGPARILPRPDSEDSEYAQFDEVFFNFDETRLAYWRRGDRIAFLHYAIQYGDGNFQLTLSAGAIPSTRAD